MLDVDFMIMPKDREVVTEVMDGLGYEAASYDLRTEQHPRPYPKGDHPPSIESRSPFPFCDAYG